METITEPTALPEDMTAPEGLNVPPEDFYPDTADKVDWVLSFIADAHSRAARIRANAETMARQAEAVGAWFQWKYGPALQTYARAELQGGRRKSLTLHHGTMGFRMKPATVTLTNEPEARAWVEANLPSALRVDVRALSARLVDTGEAVDGTKLNPAEEVFFIR